MRAVRTLAPVGLVLVLAVALVACRTAAEKTTYNPAAHQKAVALKSQVISLMSVSNESFGNHAGTVQTINAEIEEAYSLAQTAPDNDRIIAEWAAIKDPGRDLYGGFVRLWQASGQVDDTTREAATSRVTTHLNYILCLEAAKKSTAGAICVSPEAPATPAEGEEAPPA